eukprot:3380804-Prymnesium_polylepis.2
MLTEPSLRASCALLSTPIETLGAVNSLEPTTSGQVATGRSSTLTSWSPTCSPASSAAAPGVRYVTIRRLSSPNPSFPSPLA